MTTAAIIMGIAVFIILFGGTLYGVLRTRKSGRM